MQPHNSERQAALKRKREEAEEESRAKFARVNEEALANKVERQRVQEDKATRKGKAKPPPRNLRSNPRRTNRKTAKNNKSQLPGPVASEDPSKALPVVIHQTASPQQLGEHHDSDVKSGGTKGASEEEHPKARDQCMQQMLRSNTIFNRATRRANGRDGSWRQRQDTSMNGENGIRQLDAEIAHHESRGYDVLHLRQARKQQQAALQAAERFLGYTGPEMRDLNKFQAKRNNRIYNFADVPRDSPHLAFLSSEWWDLFEKCQAANITSKDLELELHELEQEDEARSEQVDQYSRHSPGKEAFAPTEIAIEDSPEALEALVGSLCPNAYRKEELSKSLQRARNAQAELETELYRITDILLVRCGMLHAEPGSEQASQSAQTPERNSAVGNDDSPDNDTEGSRSSKSSTHASRDNHEMETHDEDQPLPMSRAPGRQVRMTREEREEHARQEARKEGNRCQIHQTQQFITVASREAMLTRVAEAREKLAFCRAEFFAVEENRREVPGITSLSRDEKGKARVRYLAQKSRELTEAEDERRSALREAQNAGVIINEECQTSNFCGCDDQTYCFGYSGAPLTRLQTADVQQWLDRTKGGEEESAATPPAWKFEANMDRDRLKEPGFGEQVGEGEDREFDIPENEKQQRITCQRELQQKMRQELQDNELQQNSPMEGLEPEPAEHGFYFDLVEDNHHFNATWDGVRHAPARKIPPPTPAEGDLHPMNRDPNISPDIEQPWCWGNINRPLFRFEGPHAPAPGEEAQKSPENGPGGIEGEPEVNGSNNNQQHSNSGSNQPLPHGPSAPLIDYAIDGYDGENMDGIA